MMDILKLAAAHEKALGVLYTAMARCESSMFAQETLASAATKLRAQHLRESRDYFADPEPVPEDCIPF